MLKTQRHIRTCLSSIFVLLFVVWIRRVLFIYSFLICFYYWTFERSCRWYWRSSFFFFSQCDELFQDFRFVFSPTFRKMTLVDFGHRTVEGEEHNFHFVLLYFCLSTLVGFDNKWLSLLFSCCCFVFSIFIYNLYNLYPCVCVIIKHYKWLPT